MKALLPLVTILALCACGSGGSNDRIEQRETERQDTVGTEIANGYNNAMDKARDVENLTLEQKNRLDAALDDSEGNHP